MICVVWRDVTGRGGGDNEPCREEKAIWGCGEYTVPYCDVGGDCPYNTGETND
jgi:hypothetical protein